MATQIEDYLAAERNSCSIVVSNWLLWNKTLLSLVLFEFIVRNDAVELFIKLYLFLNEIV